MPRYCCVTHLLQSGVEIVFKKIGHEPSDAEEARTRGPSVSSQALYYWATALPFSGHTHLLL